MGNAFCDGGNPIHPKMTILDVVSRYRQTETVFRKYDEKAGVCLCCEALFDPLGEIAEKYGLDLRELLTDLGTAAEHGPHDHDQPGHDAEIHDHSH